MQKKISIFFISIMFLLTVLFCLPQNKSYKVLDIKSACEIELEKELFVLKDFACFDSNFTTKNKDLANMLNISEEEAFILGNLSKYWAENLIKGRKIKIKGNDLIFNNYSYSKKFQYSGFAIYNNKPVDEVAFEYRLKDIRKKNYRVLDLYNNDVYRVDDSIVKNLKDFLVLKKYSLPFKEAKNQKENKHKTNYKKENLKIFFTDLTTQLIPNRNCDTDLCREILYNINNTQSTIDIAIYGYSTVPLIEEALVNAQKRGVKIRLVCDSDKNGNNIYPDTEKLLNIIKTHKTDKDSLESNNTMHNKFYIFDNKIIITGSANLSHTDMSGFNSNSIVSINSPKLAQIYTQEFEQMYNGKFHNEKIPSRHEKVFVNDAEIEVYFSPQDKGLETGIIPLINQAKKYIYIPTFVLTEKRITEALINARSRGVDIKIIMDALSPSTKHSKIGELRLAGVPTKTENYAGKMHSKSIIIDDKYVIIGSMNFSNSGENRNDENFLVIKDKDLAFAYKDFFLYQWDKIDDKWLKHKARAEGKDSIGSCYDGIDNNYDRLTDLKDVACR